MNARSGEGSGWPDVEPTIVFFGGKGGVGKTTMACSYALRCADAGLRTLLISTDPAHSLGDALGVELGDDPVEVAPLLTARQPDVDLAVRRRIAQVTDDAAAAVPTEVMPAIARHLEVAASSPGMAESALADQLIEAMAQVGGPLDRLVVDSPPTGHLLRLLALPGLLTPWVSGLARQRQKAVRAERFAAAVAGEDASAGGVDDPLLIALHARRRRLEAAAAQLTAATTQVRLVLIPRRMVLAETQRAVSELSASGIRLGSAVLNQVPADADEDVVREARACFAAVGADLLTIPLSHAEPTGLPALRTIAQYL